MGQEREEDFLFLSLVLNLHGAALQQLGKIVSPISGKLERHLEGARQSIDLLECLERKTQGNLSQDEERTLQDVLTHLRLNYVDELKKDQQSAGGDAGTKPAEDPAPTGDKASAAADDAGD